MAAPMKIRTGKSARTKVTAILPRLALRKSATWRRNRRGHETGCIASSGNHRMVARAEAMRTLTRVYRASGATLGSSHDAAQAVLRSTSRAKMLTVEEASHTRAHTGSEAAGNLLVQDC